jgi:hypothetical protein
MACQRRWVQIGSGHGTKAASRFQRSTNSICSLEYSSNSMIWLDMPSSDMLSHCMVSPVEHDTCLTKYSFRCREFPMALEYNELYPKLGNENVVLRARL